MITSWFRSWHGAPTDPKWLSIAQRVNEAAVRHGASRNPCNAGMVSALFWALMDHASQADDRGDVSTFDIETYAAFSGFDPGVLAGIIVELTAKSLIQNGRLVAWEKRQPKREDSSTERTREWREKNKKRNVTQCDAREEKRREESNMPADAGDSSKVTSGTIPPNTVMRFGETPEIEKPVEGPPAKPPAMDADFAEWYAAYPRHVGRGKALKAYRAARKKTNKDTLLAGARRASREFSDPEFTPHPASWLNAERWADESRPNRTRRHTADDPMAGII